MEDWHTVALHGCPVLQKGICCLSIRIWPPAEVKWALGGQSGCKQVHFQGPITVVELLEYRGVQLPVCPVQHFSGLCVGYGVQHTWQMYCCNVDLLSRHHTH